MRDANIKKLVLAALMAALTYVATSIVQIPSPMPVSYTHLAPRLFLLQPCSVPPYVSVAAIAGVTGKSTYKFKIS